MDRLKMRTLIVDDNPNMREPLVRQISAAIPEIELVQAVNFEDAIQKLADAVLRNKPFDTVVADFFLRDSLHNPEGQRVLELAKKANPNSLTILMSTKFREDWTGFDSGIVDQFISLHFTNTDFIDDVIETLMLAAKQIDSGLLEHQRVVIATQNAA